MQSTAYLLQAALIALWQLGLYLSEDFYRAFQLPGTTEAAFNAFLLPDMVVILALSVWRAYAERRDLGLIILGGFAYATLYCVNGTLLTGGGVLPTTVMLLGLCYNLFLVYGNASFRTAKSQSDRVNGAKTLVQIVCVWSITLVAFPLLLLRAFGELTLPGGPRLMLSILLFIAFSALGLTSAYVMVRRGKGTPLPLDQTQHLVVAGPYAYVRNPMAVAGVGQGLAVALAFGSLAVLAYALLGGVLWHYVVRPVEERDLRERFGEAYAAYRAAVRCWWPRGAAYS